MAEYISSTQNVSLNSPVVFNDSIPCNRGNVFHADGTGVFILKGNTNNCFARYQVTFNGNISIPTGAALSPISVSISENGEERPSSKAIYSPTAVDTLGNVTSTAIVTVPRNCCFNVAIRYTDATVDDTATAPTPTITVSNGSLTIVRIA